MPVAEEIPPFCHVRCERGGASSYVVGGVNGLGQKRTLQFLKLSCSITEVDLMSAILTTRIMNCS